MQSNREEVYTIQLCEHMLSHLRTIVQLFLTDFVIISDNLESDEINSIIEFAHCFMESTEPDNIEHEEINSSK